MGAEDVDGEYQRVVALDPDMLEPFLAVPQGGRHDEQDAAADLLSHHALVQALHHLTDADGGPEDVAGPPGGVEDLSAAPEQSGVLQGDHLAAFDLRPRALEHGTDLQPPRRNRTWDGHLGRLPRRPGGHRGQPRVALRSRRALRRGGLGVATHYV